MMKLRGKSFEDTELRVLPNKHCWRTSESPKTRGRGTTPIIIIVIDTVTVVALLCAREREIVAARINHFLPALFW